ncbi:unnamed protein product [Diabrotica balteata]|uniref:Uncharacterized protein n=1 Tax=Diabrotica balteata TaxID=107213 RepID=A0A9N9SYC7_DIABA|nr:unnamed protein product [Diabrotica balteata]
MSNDRNISITKYHTTIDAVFTRNLNRFKSKLFISYFSYHKPIILDLEISDGNAGNDDGERVAAITDKS